MDKSQIKKVVLAYSGGLDTSIIIPWLKENYNNCEVIAVAGNVGQADELDGLEEKALKTGASKLYCLDLTDDYVDNYIIPTMKAGATYEEYLLGTSHARPCIAKALVEVALKENADAIAHGCTGKGNDQVRFELAIKAFAPDMPIIAPWREWSIKSREEEIDYAEAHNVPLKINRETNYSKDKNLWHLSHEGLDLEDTGNEPTYEKKGFLEMGVSPINAPDEPTYVELDFDKGIPVALNGEKMSAKNIILKLNELGGKNGIGILDIVENRLVGMKCRGVYETPGGAILYIVSARITKLLGEKAFQFSPAEWITIHRRLFEGVFKHAGQIRQYNITKKEWVLNGETVIYADFNSIKDTLDYDFATEKQFSYEGLSVEASVKHLAKFASDIWQIHPFGEGNTRATAVFMIKYMKTFGFRVNNNAFRENSWYFRNALVRANYNDLQKGVHSTTKFLELFFANLLLGTKHELKNRYMHIDFVDENTFQSINPKIPKYQFDTLDCTLEELAVLELVAKNPTMKQQELAEATGKSIATIKRIMKSLQDKNYIRRESGKRYGKWEVWV